ncbi:trifunctional transcriptional regulator/proline dehydrogenase/L-glutamate gamma-semialdehyde dehydrogenase [Verminephrobacter aporrectodeae]|uniref:trifunctional transcriptional regulator/proline dehydrogenase/L-glutamate gamma-semialdehyde dehydrogenase n=2 Tax=Verminephrobacter aporrectodeae TaxID=1110389 RepID=UPI0022444302|nr:trifunctional transcriptional regulator/proline dehydrogenase/L-glutamate gamma-semialdehyde dehydrogenase [Verminephrobacter aporrectodeae]MCW8174948.1 trifunctional transcriptional regulator/proline dehydrogenase/L-glutamate gamma-semialdehyde dehydrogenase [Verminephrobacter aporrectodeae subsp. tuberculatae]MCW8201545.1 trifunctional transcriptional regulator/proline dehydrogenase/L-glutamate gamma-semialdehyde dehydrogenase [Verminephrobacter aporrectodeae subsp. tuberculatae]
MTQPAAPLPFADFAARAPLDDPLRAAIGAACRRPEPEALAPLLEQARLPEDLAQAAGQLALRLAGALRQRAGGGVVQGLLQEFSLSSQEGVALMCLAEALLRIPDRATRDALIRDKISHGQWESHLGKSPSLFVNAATWGLLLTGRLVATHSEGTLSAALGRLIARGGEPLIRKGVDLSVRMMGEQFVTGETIEQALLNSRAMQGKGFRHSYDMLGEAALTAADAARYCALYEQAIHAIGKSAAGRGIHAGPGISIKLSALHPRYGRAQWARVMDELYPRLLRLGTLARGYDIGLNIDAEEADRLDLSLDLLDRLCHAPDLAGWDGVGFVVQAYQKRCPFVIDWLIALARRTRRRLMLRLVKGAYWDSEIKRAQVDGLDDYPVYTRKAHTDISYIACARRLLDAPDAVYPQFATHNAQTLASVYQLAGPDYHAGQYEFQCLYGMGEALYEQVVGSSAAGRLDRPCRIYAPVGPHETLLAYLVRRLLENGANTSFVNRIADAGMALEDLVCSPVQLVDRAAAAEGVAGLPHPRIAAPRGLYGSQRAGARGLDLADENTLIWLGSALQASAGQAWTAAPMLGVDAVADTAHGADTPLHNPADRRDLVGRVREASATDVDRALCCAQQAAAPWAATPPAERAARLLRAADLLEERTAPLLGLLVREAGKTCGNALAEVREAVDFLRYYAAQVRATFDNATHLPLGPVACISPWNFPLAIFLGQAAAALAAGNPVLAKPAEQTPLIAAEAVRLLWQAGVPRGALQLLPGRGETVGARLVADARVQGVLFTGSIEVARTLQRALAGRQGAARHPIPLIAETGGQNALIVDSSALVEQVVGDVLASAFDSAGQRCSALRVLCVQEEAAGRVLEMLRGAMDELRMGNPGALQVDIGPVIDAEAQAGIVAHIEAMQARGRRVFQPCRSGAQDSARGSFVAPTLIELEHIGELQREVFGPVLHLLRYARKDLDALLAQINATGYGLTQGLHTRIDETIARVVQRAHAGNIYVNRNMVGAVVGVQPFGGEGLSGTGPKAGGPLYLLRLLAQRPADALAQALAPAGDVAPADVGARERLLAPLHALECWAQTAGHEALAATCRRFGQQTQSGSTRTLPGPTGERNLYTLGARTPVLCLACDAGDWLTQLAAVLATGGMALWPIRQAGARAALPPAVQARITLRDDALEDPRVELAALLHHGDSAALRDLCEALARRPGPIVALVSLPPGDSDVPLERLLSERTLSVNTAAAGGNASLMAIG